jgi:UDP-N-acetylmuramoyl-tripeptide--D-alanyl-D-alanine ligase
MTRYRPRVVGVTGSVGKTSTKRAVFAVLSKVRRVRVSEGNLNNEIGVALAILGGWSAEELRLVSRDQEKGTRKGRKLLFWMKVIVFGAWRIMVRSRRYPEVLILEYGADRPGDILDLMSIALPNVAIVTAIGDIPSHVEFYTGPKQVAREKGRLIERLASSETAILNYDDDTVSDLRHRTRGKVITFGFEEGADIRVTRLEHHIVEGIPAGISFKLEYDGSSVPARLNGVFGRAPAYAAAAAACVGIAFGMNLLTISEAFADYAPAPSRMQLLPGIKDTLLIDDTYNASPLSMRAALDTLKELPAGRKVAVLGDMLEIGKYTIEAHESIGAEVVGVADILITVGDRAKFIAGAAHDAGMRNDHIFIFDTADAAIPTLERSLKQGDLVLLKASHAIGLDTVVRAVTAEPNATNEV